MAIPSPILIAHKRSIWGAAHFPPINLFKIDGGFRHYHFFLLFVSGLLAEYLFKEAKLVNFCMGAALGGEWAAITCFTVVARIEKKRCLATDLSGSWYFRGGLFTCPL